MGSRHTEQPAKQSHRPVEKVSDIQVFLTRLNAQESQYPCVGAYVLPTEAWGVCCWQARPRRIRGEIALPPMPIIILHRSNYHVGLQRQPWGF